MLIEETVQRLAPSKAAEKHAMFGLAFGARFPVKKAKKRDRSLRGAATRALATSAPQGEQQEAQGDVAKVVQFEDAS